MNAMALSERGAMFIRSWEQYRATKYLDQGGKATIGYGHLIKLGEKFNSPMSPLEAMNLFDRDVLPFVSMANRAITILPTQEEFDAFISILYNVGPGVPSLKDGIIVLRNGRPSTLLREMNVGAMVLAAAEFPKWDMVGTAPSKGLMNRRLAEQKIFATGVYVNHV